MFWTPLSVLFWLFAIWFGLCTLFGLLLVAAVPVLKAVDWHQRGKDRKLPGWFDAQEGQRQQAGDFV